MTHSVLVLDDEAILKAAALSQDHLAMLFGSMAPMIRRMSRALCGNESAGDQVVAGVLQRSVLAIERFRSVAQAQNWFSHHTVLASRRLTNPRLVPSEDVLARHGDTSMIAFVAAVRSLPFQQREAFILTHGQHYDARQMAVAMDCSTTAAANHLVAATATLRALDAEGFISHVQQMARNFASPADVAEIAIPVVLRRVKRKKLGRFLWRALLLASLFLLAYAAWRVAPMITT